MITFLMVFSMVSSLAPLLAAPACRGVICGLVNQSRCTENCGALYVTSRDGREEVYTGTSRRTRQRDVTRVRLVGTGCFVIYKGRNFAGDNYRVVGGDTHVLKEKGHNWTTLRYMERALLCQPRPSCHFEMKVSNNNSCRRSLRYSLDCQFLL